MEENMFIKGTYSMWMEEIDMEELRGMVGQGFQYI
jgi:hypothetical protein